jgi:MarR-like DNA-binding transcriptional regulator SgrR of sgrS sRNA
MSGMSAAARTRPHYGGTLRVETEGDAWQRTGGIARRLVYDGLTRIDAAGTVQSALATGWESDSDDHRWDFHLRPGVHFHDGSPLTSAAMVASLNLSCNANCPWTAVHAVGSTVVFTGESPMRNLPALLAADDFLISLVGPADGSQQGNIGTGPFQVVSTANGVLALKANEASWQGRPFADAIEVHPHRSIRDQWLDLSLGRADVVEVPAEMIRQAQQQKMILAISPPAELLSLQVSTTGSLANAQLRAAIAASVDRAPLAGVIFQKQGEATASVLPQSLSGYSFLFPTDRDLNRAAAMRGGLMLPSLSLSADADNVMQLAAQRIALNLHEAGFTAAVVSSPQHPDLILRRIPLQGGSPSAVLDQVLRACGETQIGTTSNPAALYKTERTFLDQHTLIPLVDLPRAYAIGPRARDLRLDASGMPDLADTSLEDAP